MSSFDTGKLIENIFKVIRVIKENMAYSSKACDLSILQIQALIFLKKNKNAQMTEIARHFKIELPSATSLLNKLYSMNLVKRQADSKDRRIVRIVLTKQGQMLLEDVMIERDKKMKTILSYLSEHDKNELLRITQVLVEKIGYEA